MKRVFALHFLANAILIVLLYVWFGIRDAQLWQLALTFILGLGIAGATVYLHAGTWHWFRNKNWKIARPTLLRFAAGFAAFLLAFWLLSLIPTDRAGFYTASLLTFKSRKAVRPEQVTSFYIALVWLLKWLVVPVFLFDGWRDRKFWLIAALALLLGLVVPARLVNWTPNFRTTSAEVISLILRWSVAYTLSIASWLAVLMVRPARAVKPEYTAAGSGIPSGNPPYKAQ